MILIICSLAKTKLVDIKNNKRILGLKLNLILRESLNLKFRSKSNAKKEDRNINRFVIG